MVKKKVIVELRVSKVPVAAASAKTFTAQLDMPGFKLDKDFKPGKEKELASKPTVIKVWTDAKIYDIGMDVKAVLRKTAKDISEQCFDPDSSYGIIQGQAAYELIGKSPNQSGRCKNENRTGIMKCQ